MGNNIRSSSRPKALAPSVPMPPLADAMDAVHLSVDRLLAVNRAILFQNAVDDIRERRQLRALRRLASPISRRFRMQQYLGNRLAIDPELARSFPSAQTLTMTRQSHSSIKIHSVHPPPSIRSILTKAIDGPILVRRRNRTNRPLHWGIIAPPFSLLPVQILARICGNEIA